MEAKDLIGADPNILVNDRVKMKDLFVSMILCEGTDAAFALA